MAHAETHKIRVLIADDVAETRETLTKLLRFEDDIEVVGTAATGREALSLAKQTRPDVVIMDINMPDMDGIQATEQILAAVPEAQVIMMSVQGDQDYMRRSMLAGAREFLVKPFSADDLVNSIRHVYQLALRQRPRLPTATPISPTAVAEAERPEGTILALFSPKGGVGTTTLAVNLAVAARLEARKQVVLVDGDLQFGDVGLALDLKPRRTIAELVGRLQELELDLVDAALISHSTGVRVLLAPIRPQDADLIPPDALRQILTLLRRKYELVLVDAGNHLDDRALAILDVADRILLVLTQEMGAIKNVRLFLEVADLLDYPPDKIWLVVNKVDEKAFQVPLKAIEENLQKPLAATLPYDGFRPTLALNQGVPLIVEDREGPFKKALLPLVEKLLGEGVREEEPRKEEGTPERRGIFRLFRG